MKNQQITLSFWLPVRSVAFLLVFVASAMALGTSLMEISHWWSVAAVVLNILTILLLVYLAKRNGKTYWQLINYQKGRTTWQQVVGITLLVLVIGMAGMYLAGFLCWYYYRKRTPLPIMVGHAVIDLATAGQIVATSFVPGLYQTMCSL